MKFDGTLKKYLPTTFAVIGCVALIGSFSLANSSVGGQSDPLITKSYLDETVVPSLTVEATAAAQAQIDSMTATLDAEIAALQKEIDAAVVGSGGQYEVVSLASGQSLYPDLGTQMVLRIGSVHVTSTSFPALVDLTKGESLSSGDSLTVNHLYLSTIEGRVVTSTANSTKIMVYGGYTIG